MRRSIATRSSSSIARASAAFSPPATPHTTGQEPIMMTTAANMSCRRQPSALGFTCPLLEPTLNFCKGWQPSRREQHRRNRHSGGRSCRAPCAASADGLKVLARRARTIGDCEPAEELSDSMAKGRESHRNECLLNSGVGGSSATTELRSRALDPQTKAAAFLRVIRFPARKHIAGLHARTTWCSQTTGSGELAVVGTPPGNLKGRVSATTGQEQHATPNLGPGGKKGISLSLPTLPAAVPSHLRSEPRGGYRLLGP